VVYIVCIDIIGADIVLVWNVVVGMDVQLSALRSLVACVRILAVCHIDSCINWLQHYTGSFDPTTQQRVNVFYRTIAS